MTAHCESCAYYDEEHSNSGKAQVSAEGLCRFNPPITQPAPDAHGLWPVVSKEDWCGHYSHEPAAASHAS